MFWNDIPEIKEWMNRLTDRLVRIDQNVQEIRSRKQESCNLGPFIEEINTWRTFFLDDTFEGSLKYIPEEYKNRIRDYFMAIPSESFTTPLFELHQCISVMLQNMEDKK